MDTGLQIIISFIITIMFFLGFILGTFDTSENDKLIKECSKANNVYQCKILAVPINEAQK